VAATGAVAEVAATVAAGAVAATDVPAECMDVPAEFTGVAECTDVPATDAAAAAADADGADGGADAADATGVCRGVGAIPGAKMEFQRPAA